MQFERRDRIVELVRQELAEVLRDVKDPRLSGFLTITGVELSRDMKKATAFYSILGTEEERGWSAEALKSAAPFIRYQLKLRLRLKTIPGVEFEYDKTPERAGRVLELLGMIEKDQAGFPIPPDIHSVTPPAQERPRAAGRRPRKLPAARKPRKKS